MNRSYCAERKNDEVPTGQIEPILKKGKQRALFTQWTFVQSEYSRQATRITQVGNVTSLSFSFSATLHKKEFEFRVFLVCIYPYPVQIQENTDQKTANTDTFYAVLWRVVWQLPIIHNIILLGEQWTHFNKKHRKGEKFPHLRRGEKFPHLHYKDVMVNDTVFKVLNWKVKKLR